MLAGLVRIRLYTTKINRKQSPDTGIEPETSDMPGSVLPLYRGRMEHHP